jgi:hypothetical protein
MFGPNTQFVANPSCGAPPFFTVHTARFDDTFAQFDWNLINRLNPETVEATQDSESLEKVLYSFVDSKFGAVERQFLPFPLSAKFYRLLQMGVDYLLKKFTKAQRQLSQKDKEIERMREKVERSIEALDRVPRMANTDVSIVHSCPVCSRAFKALLYVDNHMTKCHPEFLDAWRALRDGRPYGLSKAVQDLHDDIGHLRSCLTRQELEAKKPPPVSDRWPRPKPLPQKAKPIDASGKVVESRAIAPSAKLRTFVRDPDDMSGTESGEVKSVVSLGSTGSHEDGQEV